MTTLVFYEKPGCGGNARQRVLLETAGHTLERRNLLTAPWTRESLLTFLWPVPVAQWFNRAAPRVKSGEVVPEDLPAEAALALLLAEPLPALPASLEGCAAASPLASCRTSA